MALRVGASLLLGLFLAASLGAAIARRARRREAGSALDTSESALLALLGLLLGFSFSMAATRYDTRRLLVVEEANAIGTTWLRSAVLSVEERPSEAADLARYAEARVALDEARRDRARQRAALEEASALQKRLWARAVSAALAAPGSLPASLLLQATNGVIDLDEKRQSSLENKVPAAVPGLLCVVASLALFVVGLRSGLADRRASVAAALLSAAIAAVLVVILDLDSPHEGLTRVSLEPLHAVARAIRDAR